MLLVQRQSNPSINITDEYDFGDIPSFQTASTTFRSLETMPDFKEKLSVLGRVLIKHNVTDKLAFHLTHRHWEIKHQEAAIMFCVPPSIAKVSHQFSTVPSGSSVHKIPKTFRLMVKADGSTEFVTYEYIDGSMGEISDSYQNAFVMLSGDESLKNDLATALLNTGLHTVFSITIDLPFLDPTDKLRSMSIEISDSEARDSDLYLTSMEDQDTVVDVLCEGMSVKESFNTLFRFDEAGGCHVGTRCHACAHTCHHVCVNK